MSARVYVITEGVHDVYFLGKILTKTLAFKKVDKESALDEAWRPILPAWPYDGSLRPSVPAPTFYFNTNASVALVSADGIDKIKLRLKKHHLQLTDRGFTFDAIGVVLDADYKHAKQKDPVQRFSETAEVLANIGLPRPTEPERVSGEPRTGIYVLPGGGELGTLEDVLLDCAATVYPTLGCHAVRFIDGLDRQTLDLKGQELEEIGAPSGRHKAVLATMTAVLKPGKPIQASIEDHRWIEPRTLALPRVAAVARFLQELIGAPLPSPAP